MRRKPTVNALTTELHQTQPVESRSTSRPMYAARHRHSHGGGSALGGRGVGDLNRQSARDAKDGRISECPDPDGGAFGAFGGSIPGQPPPRPGWEPAGRGRYPAV